MDVRVKRVHEPAERSVGYRAAAPERGSVTSRTYSANLADGTWWSFAIGLPSPNSFSELAEAHSRLPT